MLGSTLLPLHSLLIQPFLNQKRLSKILVSPKVPSVYSQGELPYRFREREAVFNPHSQYATIKLKQFSLMGGVTTEGAEEMEKLYTALTFHKPTQSIVNVDYICLHDCQLP